MRRWWHTAAGLSLLGVAGAWAHSQPVEPSLCASTVFEVLLPAQGSSAAAAPVSLRLVYSTSASRVVFCAADPADPRGACAASGGFRAFTLNGVEGAIALPPSFPASLFASGDLVSPALPILLTVGGTTLTVPLALGTGVAAAAGATLEGAPLAAAGGFVLVGAASEVMLPAPFAAATVAVRLACTPDPPPDLDQFRSVPQVRSLAGTITSESLRLRARLDLAAGQPALDVAAPVSFRVNAGGTLVAGAGQAALEPRRRGRSYQLVVSASQPIMPALAARRVDVSLTLQVGETIVRARRAFRRNRAGTRLRAG
jgi:hypothetical protein